MKIGPKRPIMAVKKTGVGNHEVAPHGGAIRGKLQWRAQKSGLMPIKGLYEKIPIAAIEWGDDARWTVHGRRRRCPGW
jgi:hypothetical protein